MFRISTQQVKAARALLNWKQEHLAEQSGVGIATIRRLEAKGGDLGGWIGTPRLTKDVRRVIDLSVRSTSAPEVLRVRFESWVRTSREAVRGA